MSRFIVRGLARSALRRFATGTMRSSLRSLDVDTDVHDDVIQRAESQYSIWEMVELAGEAGFLIAEARDAAIVAGEGVYLDQWENYNPGQQQLVDIYALPAHQEYWGMVTDPDPGEYFALLLGQHEAMERALGHTIAAAYGASVQGAIGALQGGAADIVGTRVMTRGRNNMIDTWGDPSLNWRRATDTSDESSQFDRLGRQSGGVRGYVGNPRRHQYHNSGALRQLSQRQAFGYDVPFWHTESRLYTQGYMNGDITADQANMAYRSIYKQTYFYPNRVEPPPNYRHPLGEHRRPEYEGYGSPPWDHHASMRTGGQGSYQWSSPYDWGSGMETRQKGMGSYFG